MMQVLKVMVFIKLRRACPSAMRSLMSRSRSRVSLDFLTPCASRASSRRSRSRSRLRSSLQGGQSGHGAANSTHTFTVLARTHFRGAQPSMPQSFNASKF